MDTYRKKLPEFALMQEAADSWMVCTRTVRGWIRDGRVAHIKVGRKILIPMQEIQRIAKEGVPAP